MKNKFKLTPLNELIEFPSTSNDQTCMHCKEELGFYSPYIHVKEAIKPKRQPNRYKIIGYLCEECEDHIFEYSKDKY